MAKRSGKIKRDSKTYGIAEWYGRLYKDLGNTERISYAALKKEDIPDCPYLLCVPEVAPRKGPKCNKKGGVCSIRNFIERADGEIEFGEITATCPHRFLEDRTVIQEIGKCIIEAENPVILKEIPFLKRNTPEPIKISDDIESQFEGMSSEADTEDVGKIDLVFMHPDKEPKEWCAVEIQAVYFSGGEMSADFKAISSYTGNGIPMPGAIRRPDFRSSGPKRLMPQLQIKVPSLRRWGKKMVVIIDRPFLNAMAPMTKVDHISNCDIIWAIVDYDETKERCKATLVLKEFIYTTLEDAVVGLTAGSPTNLPEFERKLEKKAQAKN